MYKEKKLSFFYVKNRSTSIHKGCKYLKDPGTNSKLGAIGVMFYENNLSDFSIIYNSPWTALLLPVPRTAVEKSVFSVALCKVMETWL